MTFDSEKHHRRSIRLNGYDYSQSGAYFVTLCTYQKQCWFGEIRNSQMHLNQLGKIAAQEWLRTSQVRPEFQLDEWIIMPNHLHGIVVIKDCMNNFGTGNIDSNILGIRDGNPNNLGARDAPLRCKPNSLSSFVAGFKSAVTKQINLLRHNRDLPIWQRNYYESIIRDEKHLNNIREYILNNPKRWSDDPENQPQSQNLWLDLPF